jgi:hypothetical protein
MGMSWAEYVLEKKGKGHIRHIKTNFLVCK